MNLSVLGFSSFLAASLYAGEQLIPAGSLMTCTVNEKISSKIVAVGDPVLCTVGGRRTSAAYAGGSLSGQFQEYQDPGHFVGKGWMEIAFDQLMLPDAYIVPITAKVVSVPGYHVDLDGKILDVPTPFAYTGPVAVYPPAPGAPVGFFAGFRTDWQAQQARMWAQAEAYRRYVAAQNAQIAVQRRGFQSGSAGAPRTPVMQHSVVSVAATPRGGGRGQR